MLYIYGNALEVLQRTEFFELVEELHLMYIRFDLVVYHTTMQKLKKFTKLKKLVLANNFLSSYILLSKIECLGSLEELQIYDNEVLRCISLKSFIVYRFHNIKVVSFSYNNSCSSMERSLIQKSERSLSSSSNCLTAFCRSKTCLQEKLQLRSLLQVIQ